MSYEFYDNWLDCGEQKRYHIKEVGDNIPHAYKYVDGGLYVIPVEGGLVYKLCDCSYEFAQELVKMFVSWIKKEGVCNE